VAVACLLVVTIVAIATSGAVAQTQGGDGPGEMRVLGGAGKLTGRSGSTLEIEGFAGTTRVLVTSATKYRQTEATDASAIRKGACIRVSGDGDTSKALAATSVSVLDRAQMCNLQRNAGTRTFPNGGDVTNGGQLPNGGELPSGAEVPNGGSLPADGAGPQRSFGGGVTGKVKSVDGDTVVVTTRVPKQSSDDDGAGPPKLVKRTVKVTLADSTTITHSVEATDHVLVIGTCLASEGSTDSVGTVTAKKVIASEPDSDGSCTAGFGGFAGAPPSSSNSGPI